MIRVKLTKEFFRDGGFGKRFRYQIYVSKKQRKCSLFFFKKKTTATAGGWSFEGNLSNQIYFSLRNDLRLDRIIITFLSQRIGVLTRRAT